MITKRQFARLDEDQRKLFDFMGITWPYRRPKSEWHKKPDRNKLLSISDPHNPYSNNIVLNHIEAKEKDASRVIVPGDAGDYYSKSRFRKTRHQKFNDELLSVFHFLEWLATHWETAEVMVGNHDNRPEKYLVTQLDKSVDLLLMTEQNILDRLAAYFDNVSLVGTQLDKTDINLTHIYQTGDIIFTHGELSLKQSSAVLDRVEDYIRQWGHILQIKPYRVIAQAHNHRGLKEEGEPTRFLLPTASDPFSIGFEYVYGPRMIGKPPSVGYTVFYQERGRTDTNRSHNVKFEVRHGKTQPLS